MNRYKFILPFDGIQEFQEFQEFYKHGKSAFTEPRVLQDVQDLNWIYVMCEEGGKPRQAWSGKCTDEVATMLVLQDVTVIRVE